LLWKVCSTLYIAVTMSVYSFYYAKSKLVNSIQWRGRKWIRRIVIIMIVMMGISGICFVWPTIKNFQYQAILMNRNCRLVNRRWMAILWVCGDSVLSVLLLALFIRPLKVLRDSIERTTGSVSIFQSMERVTKKNRNLLFITVTVTIGVFTTIAVVGDLTMRTVTFMCAIDRLVTLQCITMTFAQDDLEYLYCYACFIICSRNRESETLEEGNSPSEESPPRSSLSMSVVFISSKSNLTVEKRNGNNEAQSP